MASCSTCKKFAEDLKSGADASFSQKWSHICAKRHQCSLCRLIWDAYEGDTAYTATVNARPESQPDEFQLADSVRPLEDNDNLFIETTRICDTEFWAHLDALDGKTGYLQDHISRDLLAQWLMISAGRDVNMLYLQPIASESGQILSLFEGRSLGSPCVDVNIIKQWLARCDKYHPRCKQNSANNSIDLMLIDVDSRTVGRVVGSSTSYVALSYRCGEAAPGSVGSDGKLPASVPDTIDDAILLTKRLGFRYLWVDCYCIPQDDPERKMDAIGDMWNIYTNAGFTIVAAWGNGDTGIAGVRPGLRPVNEFRGEFNGKQWMCVPPDDAWYQDWGRWRERAWTFQEVILSSRCVFLGATKMYFECRTEKFTEFLAEPWSISPITGDKQIMPMQYQHGLCDHHVLKPDGSLHFTREAYQTLTIEYSNRFITYLSDRLNALLGTMNAVTAQGSTSFYFGLPESFFIMALLWNPTWSPGFKPRSKNNQNCRFPSWTWMGYDFPTFIEESEWHFAGVHISKVTKTGEIIRICGAPVAPATANADTVDRDPSQLTKRLLQNDSLRFYESMMVIETLTCFAILRSSPAQSKPKVELCDSNGAHIPVELSYVWSPALNRQSLSGRCVVLALIAEGKSKSRGYDICAVLCLENQSLDPDTYVALGWTNVPREAWDQMTLRRRELRIY